MTRIRPDSRAGMVLLAVLVVIVLGALVGTIALESASTTTTNARLSFQSRTARAIAWSGLQGVMCEMESSRDRLLEGGEPTLTPEWNLFVDGATLGRVRLLPIGAPSTEATGLEPEGPLFESEAAKINLNVATAEMLARLGGMGADAAASIRSLAQGSGFASVEDLRRAGIDPADESGKFGGVALERLATAYSLDPEERSLEGSGRARARWDAEAKSFDSRLDVARGAEEAIERLVGAGVDLASAEATAKALASDTVEPAQWGTIWDALAFSESGREGLIDINRAPEGVLACVPGLESRAGEIVAARARLGEDRTRSVAWPLEAGIVTRAQMGAALPWITTRSLFWRVRVAGEIVRSDEALGEERVIATVLLDAVIDASGERARVAYLRDVTFGGAAQSIDELLASEAEPEGADDTVAEAPAERVDMGPAPGDDGAPASVAERTAPPDATPDATPDAPPTRASGRTRGRWTSRD